MIQLALIFIATWPNFIIEKNEKKINKKQIQDFTLKLFFEKKNYEHETKITTYIKSIKTSLKPIKIKEKNLKVNS